MNITSIALGLALYSLSTATAIAGGRPDHVAYPQGYVTSFKNYLMANRASGKPEIARVYANDIAQTSARAGSPLAPGSMLVMEIYQSAMDAAGNPIKDSGGNFQPGDLSGIAVMEKRADWPADYATADRAGDWGFALYDPKGQPKANELVCASCHQPYPDQDFVMTYAKLTGQKSE